MFDDPQTTAAIVTGAFTIVAGLMAIVITRYLRERGEVRSLIEGWSLTPHEENKEVRFYTLQVHLFNQKDVQVGLAGVYVVFLRHGKERVVSRPYDRTHKGIQVDGDGINEQYSAAPRAGFITLPPREWTSINLAGDIRMADLQELGESNEVALTAELHTASKLKKQIGYLPDGKTFNDPNTKLIEGVRPWWRRLLGR